MYNNYYNPYNPYLNYYNSNNPYNPYYNRYIQEQLNQNQIKDHGAEPLVVNMENITKQNNNFRTTLWTGNHMQITLMTINPGESIGLELHPDVDQFLRIEQGNGVVKMGDLKENLDFERIVYDDFAIVIPAGKWHNIINIGNIPLKLYSIYAPPEHKKGTIHKTKYDAIQDEHEH